jgi:predicted nucleic acid-binding protein
MRVYADASVFGLYTNIADAQAAQDLMNRFRNGDHILVTSELVERELRRSVRAVRDLYAEMLALLTTEYLTVTSAATALQGAYLTAGVVSQSSANDALHVALATVAHCPILTSLDRNDLVKNGKI